MREAAAGVWYWGQAADPRWAGGQGPEQGHVGGAGGGGQDGQPPRAQAHDSVSPPGSTPPPGLPRALLAPPWALPPSVTPPPGRQVSLPLHSDSSSPSASTNRPPAAQPPWEQNLTIFSDRRWSRFQLVRLVVYKWVKDRPSLLAPMLFVSSLISRKVPNSHPVAPNSNSYTLRHLK